MPLLVNVPHSGDYYPQDFINASRLDAHTLRQSEDMYVDELCAAAPDYGAAMQIARYPRCYVDLNRAADEHDPVLYRGMKPFEQKPSMRAAVGLGIIPRIVAEHKTIYKGKLDWADAQRRIETIYQPYHAHLQDQFDALHNRFGVAHLLDVHSMPGKLINDMAQSIDINIGDQWTRSCAPHFSRLVADYFTEQGYQVTRNHPYAGGFITRHYGQPHRQRHALQIEINRNLYMDETSYQKKVDFVRLKTDITGLMAHLSDYLTQFSSQQQAAE